MLTSLFTGQIVDTIAQALESAGVGADSLAVLGQPRVAQMLCERGYHAIDRVLVISDKPRSLRRAKVAGVYARLEHLPVARGSLAGLVAFDLGQRDDWARTLAEWSRAVRPGGAIVLVDRASPSELTRRVLCSGLTEIEQRQTGRTFVTSGVTRRT